MKKFLTLMTLILLSLSLFAMGAREINDDVKIVKVIEPVEMSSGTSLLVMDENGTEIIYHFSPETKSTFPVSYYKGGEVLAIKDNGIMTMSLPGQTTAVEVTDITLGVNLKSYTVTFPEKSNQDEYPAQRVWNAEVTDELTDQFSYAYGYDLLASYLTQGLTLRGAYFAKGVVDFWSFAEPMVTVDEMNTYLDKYINEVYALGVQDSVGDVPASWDEINALTVTDDLSEMFSYSYGYYISFQLFYSGLELNGTSFANGSLHALFNDVPLLNQSERDDVMNKYSEKLQQEYDAYIQSLSEENLKNANAFLSENRNADGVIETASGLQYKVMVSADGPKPSQDSTVTLSYKLNDLNGNTLDQNSNIQFNLTNTVPGFKEAVSNMSVGETIVAYVHPDLGYGAQLLDTIEPNSLLIFEIELISID